MELFFFAICDTEEDARKYVASLTVDQHLEIIRRTDPKRDDVGKSGWIVGWSEEV